MEAHIGPQLEFPNIGLNRTPAQCQAGQVVRLRIRIHQLVEDGIRHRIIGRKLMIMRVKRGDRRRHRHGDTLRQRALRRKANESSAGGQRQLAKITLHPRPPYVFERMPEGFSSA